MKRKPVTKPVDLEKRARRMASQWAFKNIRCAYVECNRVGCGCNEKEESLTKLLLRFAKGLK